MENGIRFIIVVLPFAWWCTNERKTANILNGSIVLNFCSQSCVDPMMENILLPQEFKLSSPEKI
jgi:hypothetical protein